MTRLPRIACVLLLMLSSTPSKAETTTKGFVAFSMTRAQEILSESPDWNLSDSRPDVFYLGGITWPWAALLDAGSGEWILVGERESTHAPLTLDDWVVALRARYFYPEVDPGVTLLPRSDGCADTSGVGCWGSEWHEVKFFGGIEDTAFGATCLEADLLLKRLVLGLEELPKGTQWNYLTDLAADARNRYAFIATRFWIYPLRNQVNVRNKIAFLEYSRLGVFSEVMHMVGFDGSVIELTEAINRPEREFARQLTDTFSELARQWPAMDRVQALTRLAGLAGGVKEFLADREIEYFLSSYRTTDVDTEPFVKVQRRSVTPDFEIAGGVDLAALLLRLGQGDNTAFRDLVMRSRPNDRALLWEFEADIRNGRFTALRYGASGSESASEPLLKQAELLSKRGHYKSALKLFDRVLGEHPKHEPAYAGRALTLFRAEQYKLAIREMDQLLALSASGENYLLRGLLKAMRGSLRAALKDIERAIELNPSAVAPRIMRAIVTTLRPRNDIQMNLQTALFDLNRVLKIAPHNPVALFARGCVWRELGVLRESDVYLSRAIEDLTKVIDSGRLAAKAHLLRGVALLDLQNYSASLEDFNKALEEFPQDSSALAARATALEGMRQFVAAEVDRRQALKGESIILQSADDIAEAMLPW